MRRNIKLMLRLINEGKLFIEEQEGHTYPLLEDDLEGSPAEIIRPATKKDIPDIAISPAWWEMLSSGRAFV